ncbi:TniQ family protein [Mycolicibacterium neoaurum]|uniref:TniQ family protein n=1 Tax=Mycolicibacterium neoaurum TaxID=1795 RepID=UPI001F2CBC55|nr:TniQ family protein [Mycolicibacterium neoaurum]
MCAYAHRNDVTWRQMLTATGLHRRRGDMEYIGWACRLHAHEINILSDATDIDPDVLQAMTLNRYATLGVHVVRRPTRVRRGALNRTTCPKRFCPQCLHETHGRWQLTWSLDWTFACTHHQRLLGDRCPRCLRPPMRPAPLTDTIPNLRRCTQSGDRHGHTVCGADLCTDTPNPAPPEVIAAQQTINNMLDGDITAFTMYDPTTVTPAHILADLRALAGDIAQTHTLGSDRMNRVADRYATAVHALRAPDIPTAAARLRQYIAASEIGVPRRTELALRTSSRHVLAGAIELAALDTELPSVDTLRYRTCTPIPRVSRRPAAALAMLTRALPTVLWPEWASFIVGEAHNVDDVQRAALACLVAHVGTDTPTSTIATMLGNTAADISQLIPAMCALRTRPDRVDVLTRVITLADQLSATSTAVDYHRRRRLDYTDLLSNLGNKNQDPLRCRAFELLSGLTYTRAPWYQNSANFNRQCRTINRTQALSETAVNDSMEEFLRDQGIDEPIIAMPTLP